MFPQIDILIAVYNGERYIEEQITSILNQAYPNLHLIIRDDASQDNSLKVLEKIQQANPNRVTLLIASQNEGVIGNFASLMQHSKSEYVMFSDGDDVWHRDKVEKTFARFMELEEKYGKNRPLLVHTDLTIVGRNLETVHPSFWKFSHLNPRKGHALNRLVVQNVITGCTVMINRSLLNLALPIPENVVMHDWWLGLLASSFGRLGLVSEPTILYRQHGLNDTGAKKYSITSLKQHFDEKTRMKLVRHRQNRFRQVKAFLERFSALLTSRQQHMLEDFLSLENASFFKKRYLMAKNGFYKHGFFRNAIAFLPFDVLRKVFFKS